MKSEYMRILITLKSLSDQIVDRLNYHKLQGFMYGMLLKTEDYSYLHNIKSYKFFNYSCFESD